MALDNNKMEKGITKITPYKLLRLELLLLFLAETTKITPLNFG